MYNTILLAVALQRWDRHSAHALAARDLALFMARDTSKRLHVLSAYDVLSVHDYEYTRPTEMMPEMADKIWNEEREYTDKIMEQKLDEYIAPLKKEGLKVTKILRNGSPREVIVQVAGDIDADLIIIGSHSKRGILDIALGGTAQAVSRRAPCTVVLVSPKA